MPIYEYRCSHCREKTQLLEKVGRDSTGERCRICGRGSLKKVFSTFKTAGAGSRSCEPGADDRFR